MSAEDGGAPKTPKAKKEVPAVKKDDDAGKSAGIDPRVQNEIGKHLRAVYDDVISEPVPDRFMELLEQLERSARKD